jgi:hypothetical protein
MEPVQTLNRLSLESFLLNRVTLDFIDRSTRKFVTSSIALNSLTKQFIVLKLTNLDKPQQRREHLHLGILCRLLACVLKEFECFPVYRPHNPHKVATIKFTIDNMVFTHVI